MGTDKLVEHGMHIDVLDAEDRDYLKTSIYYMNTCDGYTLFEAVSYTHLTLPTIYSV